MLDDRHTKEEVVKRMCLCPEKPSCVCVCVCVSVQFNSVSLFWHAPIISVIPAEFPIAVHSVIHGLIFIGVSEFIYLNSLHLHCLVFCLVLVCIVPFDWTG